MEQRPPLTPAPVLPPADSGSRGGAPSALEARGISKRFPGGVVANDRVDLTVRPGEVHALLGENGSGKTTLCRALVGLHQPDDGEILVNGERVYFGSPSDAHRAGVFMVHQHFSLVERMTVAENVVLGWSQHGGFRFDRRATEAQVAAVSERLDIQVDPGATVSQLSVGERQRVEILKALYRGARTLILDEPTTVLTPQEVEHLFELLRGMTSAGGSVVFISHKLHEVLAVCDRVSVLRRGRTTANLDLRTADVDAKELARVMVGRVTEPVRRPARMADPDPTNPLQLFDVVTRSPDGHDVLKGVSLAVRAGEILGIAGVAGNGQRDLADVICGLRPLASGSIVVDGVTLQSGMPRAAIAAGIAYVPEDRMGVGLAPGLQISENLVLKSFGRAPYSTALLVRRGRVLERAHELLERFTIKGRPETLIRQLSGGNAQKVLLARELSSRPRVLVVAAATRGLDVAATEAIRTLLIEAATSRVAVVMISEDLDEILDLADRVAVMCDGIVTGIVDPETASVEEIGLLMMGQRGDAST